MARFIPQHFITVVPPRPSREGELMQSDLREAGLPVFDTMIRRTVGFAKAAMAGKPIRDAEGAGHVDVDDPRADRDRPLRSRA